MRDFPYKRGFYAQFLIFFNCDFFCILFRMGALLRQAQDRPSTLVFNHRAPSALFLPRHFFTTVRLRRNTKVYTEGTKAFEGLFPLLRLPFEGHRGVWP